MYTVTADEKVMHAENVPAMETELDFAIIIGSCTGMGLFGSTPGARPGVALSPPTAELALIVSTTGTACGFSGNIASEDFSYHHLPILATSSFFTYIRQTRNTCIMKVKITPEDRVKFNKP